MPKPPETYVGKKACGCVIWVCSTELEPVPLAKEITDASEQGLTVEKWPTQQAIDAFCAECPHEHPTLDL